MAHPDGKPDLALAPISMILPVRNQSARIERAVAAWHKTFGALNRPFQILIVDDGSTDDTPARADPIKAQHPEVLWLRHEQPQGFGAALRTALPHVQHPLVFLTALDYPYTTSDLRHLLDRIDSCDLVSGFRAAVQPPGWYRFYRRVVDGLLRILIGLSREPLPGWLGWKVHLYNRLMRTILGVQLDDAESAYKLIRREVFDRFPIQSDGIFALTEIAAKANFTNHWLDEVPIRAQSGVPPEALRIAWSWRERRRDFGRVFRRPEFDPPFSRRLEAPANASPESAATPSDRSASGHLEATPTEP
jgi:glycosyltransferase involved in cell wall biosynthesis